MHSRADEALSVLKAPTPLQTDHKQPPEAAMQQQAYPPPPMKTSSAVYSHVLHQQHPAAPYRGAAELQGSHLTAKLPGVVVLHGSVGTSLDAQPADKGGDIGTGAAQLHVDAEDDCAAHEACGYGGGRAAKCVGGASRVPLQLIFAGGT